MAKTMAELPQVLCFGEILFDIISNEPGVPYDQVKSWTPYPGGAPANVACALAKLGTTSGFIGCVGQDDPGDRLITLLKEIGVDTTGVQRHPTAPTREIDVILTTEGDRQFVGFRSYDSAAFADTRLNAAALPESLFEAADYFVCGTLEMPYPATSAALDRALDLAVKHQVKLVLDVNWRPVFWPNPDHAIPKMRQLVQRADFLKLAEEEADLLFDTRDPGAIAQQLPQTTGILVTAGETGCTYCIRNHQGHYHQDHIPAFPVAVVETTGAGDGFLAGFIHRLNQLGLSALDNPQQVHAIVTYAGAVGALTVTGAGAIAAQPTAAEVDAFLQHI